MHTYERRVSLVTVPDLEEVVLALAGGDLGLDLEDVSEVDPDKVADVRSDLSEAGNVRWIWPEREIKVLLILCSQPRQSIVKD